MDIKIKKQIIFGVLVFVFNISFFCSQLILAETLVRTSDVSEMEFKSYLSDKPNFYSFKQYFISKNDALNYSLTKSFLEAEEETDLEKQKLLIDKISENLGHTFLSVQKRILWIETLKLKKKNFTNNQELNLDEQIISIQNRNSLFDHRNNRNYFQLTEISLDKTDDIFINGWEIHQNEIQDVFLDKSLYYHFLILSNTKSPFVKIEKPDNLNINRTSLISGSCTKPDFNSKIEELANTETLALFPDKCLTNQFGIQKQKLEDEIAKSYHNDDSFNNNWRKSPYTYGALLVGIALLVNYTELQNYRVRITLPF
jgi:hypothetical protein